MSTIQQTSDTPTEVTLDGPTFNALRPAIEVLCTASYNAGWDACAAAARADLQKQGV